MRQRALRHVLVEFIPEQLEDGWIYISQRYSTATHRCCCGCGCEVVTPIGPADWSLEIVNGTVTLRPSIGNWSLPCRSHYLIRQGKVVWAREMSRDEIEYGRHRDRLLRDAHFVDVNRVNDESDYCMPAGRPQSQSWLVRLGQAVRWLLRRSD